MQFYIIFRTLRLSSFCVHDPAWWWVKASNLETPNGVVVRFNLAHVFRPTPSLPRSSTLASKIIRCFWASFLSDINYKGSLLRCRPSSLARHCSYSARRKRTWSKIEASAYKLLGSFQLPLSPISTLGGWLNVHISEIMHDVIE